jgi:hypothetical protein
VPASTAPSIFSLKAVVSRAPSPAPEGSRSIRGGSNINHGRKYGAYVKFGKVNATLPQGSDPETLTVEEAVTDLRQVSKDLLRKGSGESGRQKPRAPAKAPRRARRGYQESREEIQGSLSRVTGTRNVPSGRCSNTSSSWPRAAPSWKSGSFSRFELIQNRATRAPRRSGSRIRRIPSKVAAVDH